MRLFNASNALNLDVCAEGQLLDADAGAGRLLVGQVGDVDLVDGAKVGHVGEVNVELDDVVQVAAGGLEDSLEVVHDLLL